MNVLFIGDPAPQSTARHRAEALVRCGHAVSFVDAGQVTQARAAALSKPDYWTGYRFLQHRALAFLRSRVDQIRGADLVWIDGGEMFGARCAKFLKSIAATTVLVNMDDPTGPRERPRFGSLRRALPYYDLCVTFREPTLRDLKAVGAKVLRRPFAYDEIYHAPPSEAERAASPYPAGIVFIGTWMRGENRDVVLAELIRRGLPVSIYGGRWQLSPHWGALRRAWRGGALYGRDYVMAINSADVCLGFLSSGNRDSHTTRTFEVPYAGGLLVAQRTDDHERFYADGTDIVLWSTPEECAERCAELLADPARAAAIRAAGARRVRELGVGNESLVSAIVAAAVAPEAVAP